MMTQGGQPAGREAAESHDFEQRLNDEYLPHLGASPSQACYKADHLQVHREELGCNISMVRKSSMGSESFCYTSMWAPLHS
jgi:hypothetical protein